MLSPQDLGWFFSGLPCMGLLCIAKGLQSLLPLHNRGLFPFRLWDPWTAAGAGSSTGWHSFITAVFGGWLSGTELTLRE